MAEPVPSAGENIEDVLASLLACSQEELPTWLETHRSLLNLPLLQALKDTYATTPFILAQPVVAERATRYALLLAEQMPNEPLALPLARWARGLYEVFHDPEQAITLLHQALPVYQAAGNELVVAFLNVNLVAALTDCGRFAEAEAAYAAARPELVKMVDEKPIYLLWLEQNYGWLLHSQGRYAEALHVLDQALALAQRHNFPNNITGIQVNRHLALGMLGRLAEVETGFLAERTTALAQQQMLTVARIDMNLGDLYTWQGRVADALQHFQQAQQTFAVLDNEMEVASVLFRQAALLNRIGARRAALRHYAQALPRFTQRQMTPQIGELLVHYAIAHRKEGEYRRAVALLAEAATVWRQLANPLWQALVLLERCALALEQADYVAVQQLLQQRPVLAAAVRLQAEFDLLQGDLGRLTAQSADDLTEAQQAYLAASAYATVHGERWIERQAQVGLGKLWLATDPARAAACFEAAAAIDTAMRQTLTVEELKASFHEQANDLFDDLIPLMIKQGQQQQAYSYIGRAKAAALVDLLLLIQQQHELPAAVLTQIEQTRQQIATLRWQQASQVDPTLPTTAQPQNNAPIAALEQHLLDLRRQRNQAGVGSRQPVEMGTVSAVAASLANRQVDLLLEYVRCGDDLWGMVIDQQGNCAGVPLADVETLADLSARLQLRFGNVVAQSAERRRQWNERWLAECLPLLQKCFQMLIAPLLAQLPSAATATRWLLAPCDPLFLLPFAAFWDGRQFLGETCQLELIPSGAVLGYAAPTALTHSPPLIIAAATGTMTAVRTEAQQVAVNLPTSVTLIDAPALAYLRALAAPPKILHLAAHSLLRADAPLFTGLQLTGEVLTVEQSYELSLRGTELVTLSGCSTASGQESESALLAFQTAFLLAGAQRVLTTLWPIADDATVQWMTHFYCAFASGSTVPQALQQAQQHCLTDPALQHPALWAPFTITCR